MQKSKPLLLSPLPKRRNRENPELRLPAGGGADQQAGDRQVAGTRSTDQRGSSGDAQPQPVYQCRGDSKANFQRNHRFTEGFAYTDSESHILKGVDGWVQGINCQTLVDGDHQIIVPVGFSNQASDQHHIVPILERIVANTDKLPEKMIGDAGYCNTSNIEASGRGLDTYISTSHQTPVARQTATAITGASFKRTGCAWPVGPQDPLQGRASQLRTAKEHRRTSPWSDQRARGLERFLLSGLQKVDSGWALMAITHNIRKLHRAPLATC